MRKRSFRGYLIFAAGLFIASVIWAGLNQPEHPKSGSAAEAPNNNQASVSPAASDQQKPSTNQNERSDEIAADWWMVRLTGVIGAIGFLQLWVFGLQARRLWQAIEKMDEIASSQAADMRESISEAARAAGAMENVAVSMRVNANSIVESVEITKGMAERQGLIAELQTRAYVAVNYIGIVPQNAETGYRFELRVQMIGSGLTPAYNVSHRTAADVLDFPLPPDFDFPFNVAARDPSGGIGILGPRNNFIISAATPRIYSQEEIDEFQAGIRRRIFVWGEITYDDAFGTQRYVNFCQSIVWMADRSTTLGFNDPRHNDAN